MSFPFSFRNSATIAARALRLLLAPFPLFFFASNIGHNLKPPNKLRNAPQLSAERKAKH
jgi:hypothetical protein